MHPAVMLLISILIFRLQTIYLLFWNLYISLILLSLVFVIYFICHFLSYVRVPADFVFGMPRNIRNLSFENRVTGIT